MACAFWKSSDIDVLSGVSRIAVYVCGLRIPVTALLLILPTVSEASLQLPLLSVTSGDNQQDYTVNLQIFLILTVLAFLPGLLMVTTSFTRVLIVLAILRQALGLQQTPPTRVLIASALILTVFIMKPVFNEIREQAVEPYLEERMPFREAIEVARLPLHQFMLKQTRKVDMEQFLVLSGEISPVDDGGGKPDVVPENIPFSLLMPAFLSSEIKTSLQMGLMILLPFLVIDLLVASILMALGMIMLSPMLISLPFKLLLFVLVDGWGLIMAGTIRSFST
ncbi:flagellar type III secretion system pore protein FliP [Endozoicomonas sp. GU-1]|uniref:flagellar type III secretion system pore protein FliP n=1 Tax=Endozoicomonas sp. GU-1 TaxID=3009078 RepID=UPI0022B2CF58|nr:flagellar type III secretion system pore protein FliP [Endozoicomonas sp. GU-1]WBA82511.1 flagellar type III secretion system pore protein FliP [Endozoicomonas sp. GU-1]WBA85442.1 flagellar type III secretion system pore protein FliP [Endozoicomonas sp. GU-1]